MSWVALLVQHRMCSMYLERYPVRRTHVNLDRLIAAVKDSPNTHAMLFIESVEWAVRVVDYVIRHPGNNLGKDREAIAEMILSKAKGRFISGDVCETQPSKNKNKG